MNARSLTGALALLLVVFVTAGEARRQEPRAFATPEEAARALAAAARADGMDALLAIFGSAGRELFDTSDPGAAQRNRQTFAVAFAEEWRVEDLGVGRKELVIGHESWPFPVPLVKTARGWAFDVAAGKDEILNRRIGRNELATIETCLAYVKAQRAYAKAGHDGKPAGIYARRMSSDPGTQNGLYWDVKRGEPRSPLGDLVAQAAADGDQRDPNHPGRTPFHGYFFRIVEAQGFAAGGAKQYVVDGNMTGGFALVAWPAKYDATGVMTFIVNQDGVVHEKDLGPETATRALSLTLYDPDSTWARVDRAAPSR
jgi:Protein of unknown function (DUF2950)